jgi:hypothetical protein
MVTEGQFSDCEGRIKCFAPETIENKLETSLTQKIYLDKNLKKITFCLKQCFSLFGVCG